MADSIGDTANMEALFSDHDYLEKPLLECYADNMVKVISPDASLKPHLISDVLTVI